MGCKSPPASHSKDLKSLCIVKKGWLACKGSADPLPLESIEENSFCMSAEDFEKIYGVQNYK